MSIFVNQEKIHFHSIFSLVWAPQFIFLSPRQPNTLQKSFSSYFLSKVFHPPYFTSKQTYPKSQIEFKNQCLQKCHNITLVLNLC